MNKIDHSGAVNRIADILRRFKESRNNQKEEVKEIRNSEIEDVTISGIFKSSAYCHDCNKTVTDIVKHLNEVHRVFKS